ncbi:MAG: ATP-binding protein [Candidatus Binataceae bacterium]
MATQLNRVAFTTDRTLEFFSESELTTQLGYGPKLWPLVLVKELIDNALDACEATTAITPDITVTIDNDALTVTDNGPGLPAAIVERSLDYRVRISNKKHYVAPTRGQLGNALKCVWAAPFVAHGQGLIEVAAGDRHHRIEVSLNRIAQQPQINHTVKVGAVKKGTSVKIRWPQVASYPANEYQDFYRAESLEQALGDLIADFAAFNPHASFALCVQTRRVAHHPATDPSWRKWRADAPTSPYWYTPATLRGLIAAYLNEGDRHLRDFVGEFSGLAGTQVRADVLGPFTKAGVRKLSDLVVNGDVDLGEVTRLLAAMKAHSKPVEPTRLGVLGRAHLEKVLTGRGAGAIKYCKVADLDEQGLPFVVEVAFGIKEGSDREADQEEDTAERRLIVGMNWSPVFKIPASSIEDILGNQCLVGRQDSVVYLLHMAHPHFEFTDHGKGALADE